MKKSRLSIALMTALLSVGTLAGCDDYYATFSPNGELISYTVDGEEHTITADKIFKEYYNDSDKYQSIFDAIKSIIVKNYFSVEKVEHNGDKGIELGTDAEGNTVVLGKAQLKDLEVEARRDVSADKYQAKLNAKNNDTNYDDEFEKILSSKNVETENELYEKYLDEKKVAKFDDNYYKYHLDEIKTGSDEVLVETTETDKRFWKGYFDDMLPYHVSHILVKLEDSSATNYYNGTISEANCEKLYLLMDELVNGSKKFGKIANTYSEDDGSKAKYGDLGIMDYSTSYVNEFKLGVYAYENIFGEYASEAQQSKINIPDDGEANTGIEKEYLKETNKLHGNVDFPEVDVNVFTDLYKSRKQTRSTKIDDQRIVYDYEVMEGNSLVFPRNVIYNQQLNKHSFAFVTTTDSSKVRLLDASVEGATGFHTYKNASASGTDKTADALNNKNILSVVSNGEIRPILMVRAGTGDYQGIHFIVVNRDAFLAGADAHGVTRDEYYTTYHTNQDGYPKNEDKTPKQTYVNFNNEFGGQDSNSRADTFVSTLKSYDSDKLSKFIFKKYLKAENIKISDPNLDYALNKWIDKNLDSKNRNAVESWENTWTEYVGTLRKETEEREKLMSSLARIGFDYDVKSKLSETANVTLVKQYATKGDLYWNGALVTASNVDDWYTEVINGKYETFEDFYTTKGGICNDGKKYEKQ